MRLSNVAGFVCHIINTILLLYSIIFYGKSMNLINKILYFLFWLIANIIGLLFAASAGVIVNHMVSVHLLLCIYQQARQEEVVGSKLPRASRRLGAPLSLKIIKYTKMRHLKKSKNFLSRGASENVSPGPAVALNGPACQCLRFSESDLTSVHL